MKGKEFKKIMTDAGMDFTLYGYDGILNAIILMSSAAEEKYRIMGLTGIARYYKKISETIFTALNERGYYDSKGVK